MNTKKGIDVSTWQGAIDWAKVKEAGINFAMIRLGYGSSNGVGCSLDKYFTTNVEGALKCGVDVGVYFYSYALSPSAAAKEAAFVLEKLKPYAGRISYPVAYDIEDKSQQGLGKGTLTDMVVAFCAAIEAGGYYSIYYCNLSWRNNYLNSKKLERFDFWLAQWASTPTSSVPFGIWQSTSSGKVPGINGNVDLDTAYKDYPAIIAGAGLNGYGKSTGSGGKSTRQRIVEIAIKELGHAEPTGDDKYIEWYNDHVLKTWKLPLDSAWCAMFVSWCLYEAGVTESVVAPFCGCTAGMNLLKKQGVFRTRASGYIPQPGDLIFYDWDNSGDSDHVGIVEKAEGGRVHTIEGNTSNMVARRSYSLTSTSIVGYACPKYSDDSAAPAPDPAPEATPAPSDSIKAGDKVRITGSTYATGQTIPDWVKRQEHIVSQISGAKALLGHPNGINSWVLVEDLEAAGSAAKISVGSKVRVRSGAKTYTGGSLASFVYSTTYNVIELKGDRAVIGIGTAVTAAVKLADLTLA